MEGETLEAARVVAFRFLGYSARSRSEMQKRLERDGFPEEVIAAVLAECKARGWIDDEKFARDWIADRADRKGYGRTRLAAELRNRGVDPETVGEAMEAVDDDAELARAVAAARPKWPAARLADLDFSALQAEKRRLANFLQRRGFNWRIIGQVFAILMENQE